MRQSANALIAAIGFFALAQFSTVSLAQSGDEMLRSQSIPEQKQTLLTAVQSSGGTCQQVTDILRHENPDIDGNHYWAVACSNGLDYMVRVPENVYDSVSVLECEIASMMGVDCWAAW